MAWDTAPAYRRHASAADNERYSAYRALGMSGYGTRIMITSNDGGQRRMNPGAGQQQQPSDTADRRDDALGIVAIDDDEPVVLLDGVEVTDPWAPGAWDPRP